MSKGLLHISIYTNKNSSNNSEQTWLLIWRMPKILQLPLQDSNFVYKF